MPTISPLTHATLDEFVRAHRLAVIYYWAEWNESDIVMQQQLDSQIPVELSAQFAFGCFDVDPPEHHETCRRHGVLNLPFLEFYREGLLIRTITGISRPEVLLECLREAMERTDFSAT